MSLPCGQNRWVSPPQSSPARMSLAPKSSPRAPASLSSVRRRRTPAPRLGEWSAEAHSVVTGPQCVTGGRPSHRTNLPVIARYFFSCLFQHWVIVPRTLLFSQFSFPCNLRARRLVATRLTVLRRSSEQFVISRQTVTAAGLGICNSFPPPITRSFPHYNTSHTSSFQCTHDSYVS